MEFHVYNSQREFVSETIEYVEWLATQAAGMFCVGLSGGRTPIPLYTALAQSKMLDFSLTTFFLVDERYVPIDHAESNYKMIHETLGRNERAQIVHFDTLLPLQQSVALFSKEFVDRAGGVLDVAILGIGKDGHIASLFPYDEALHNTAEHEYVLHTINPSVPNPPVRDRLSLSMQAIMKSRHILLIANKNKTDAIEALLHSNKTATELPAKKLLEHDHLRIHFVEN